MFQRNPNLPLFTFIFIARLCYAFWSWIRPTLILPSHAINYTKKYILIVSKLLVIISSLLLPLHLQFTGTTQELVPTPIVLVIDQSRSMAHNDLTPSRWSIATQITNSLPSSQIQQLISYAQIPQIHSGVSVISSLQPISSQAGSSALGDAWLIAYDQIASGLNYKPIVITITDGGSNTGYDLSQTADILKTRAQLWIVGLSTGTQIVAYDDDGRGLTSSMNSALLRSLTDSGHRYPIPNDASISGVIDTLSSDLYNQYYRLGPLIFDLGPILWLLLGGGVLGWWGIYLTKSKNNA